MQLSLASFETPREARGPQDEGRESFLGCLERRSHVGRNISIPTKKDQLALALLVARTDPILFDPGGLGAEESGTERTGSTHVHLFAVQGGSR
ncbi:hypothetical protein XH99_15790 [Bradyrhizobium nanningense]|uniref:Uncharacterized protein n=1 Tax=Bradyrhizobium nanningense TaxID=1325118 RepID=A0A4Q0S3F0_9BRAD|nr:hypothetical protein XH84_33750 [Bradyrhizobium nanningense]RXH28100.1 hypothetical protein XH99_15790 [Bradyrhizobium nanningense]